MEKIPVTELSRRRDGPATIQITGDCVFDVCHNYVLCNVPWLPLRVKLLIPHERKTNAKNFVIKIMRDEVGKTT